MSKPGKGGKEQLFSFPLTVLELNHISTVTGCMTRPYNIPLCLSPNERCVCSTLQVLAGAE